MEPIQGEQIDEVVTADSYPQDPESSVVVVTYRISEPVLDETLDALSAQTATDFEVVIVDNGCDWAVEAVPNRSEPVSHYLRLDRNRGVTTARNIGARVSSGDMLLFLDDDGVPREDFVAQHRRCHREHDIVAARGRVLPKTDNAYNRFQSTYQLGDETIPYYISTEGNFSIDRETFLSHGGFDEQLEGRAGHEGLDLTYRLVHEGVPRRRIVYYPHAVIYHDYANGFREYVTKTLGRKNATSMLRQKEPDLFEFARSYDTPGEPSTVRRRLNPFLRGGSLTLAQKLKLLAARGLIHGYTAVARRDL